MTAHCFRRTSIFDVIKSDVITLITVHFKDPFYVLEKISDGMFLWNFNWLWRQMCVLFNFIHYLLNDPCMYVPTLQLTLCELASWNFNQKVLIIRFSQNAFFHFFENVFSELSPFCCFSQFSSYHVYEVTDYDKQYIILKLRSTGKHCV